MFIIFHSEKNFIISGVCLVRSLSCQEFVFQKFVFPEFVFQEFVFQEFVMAPILQLYKYHPIQPVYSNSTSILQLYQYPLTLPISSNSTSILQLYQYPHFLQLFYQYTQTLPVSSNMFSFKSQFMQNPVYNIYLLSEIPSMSKTQFIMYLFFKITYLWGQIYLWGKNSVYGSLKSYIYEGKTLSIALLNPIFMKGNTVYCSLISYIYGWKHCLLLSEILYWWVETLSIALLNSIFMRCKLCLLLTWILYLWGETLSFLT